MTHKARVAKNEPSDGAMVRADKIKSKAKICF